MPSVGSRWRFWVVLALVVVVDAVTKALAASYLDPFPRPIVGEWVTLQLVYNTGAAFGISVGEHSRWVFTGLAIIALVILGSMARQTKPDHVGRLTALALVSGGAIGNLVDRLRSSQGVVDFIDMGIGVYRWPTFNVADMAVTFGAVTLAVTLWLEGKHAEPAKASRRAADTASASS